MRTQRFGISLSRSIRFYMIGLGNLLTPARKVHPRAKNPIRKIFGEVENNTMLCSSSCFQNWYFEVVEIGKVRL